METLQALMVQCMKEHCTEAAKVEGGSGPHDNGTYLSRLLMKNEEISNIAARGRTILRQIIDPDMEIPESLIQTLF